MRVGILAVLVGLGGCGDDPPEPVANPPVQVKKSVAPKEKGVGLGQAIAEAVGLAKSSGSFDVVPNSAEFVGGVDLAALVASPWWSDARTMFNKPSKQGLEILTGCKVGPPTWRRAAFGFETAREAWAVAVEAEGVGKSETVECLRKAAEDNGDTLKPEDGGKKLVGRREVVFVVREDVVAMASSNWASDVEQRIAGKGVAASKGGLKALVERVDRKKHVWIAGKVPSVMAGFATTILGSAPTDVTATIDAKDGVAIDIALGVGDPGAARDALEKQWVDMKGTAAAFGAPAPVAESVKFGTKGGTVTMQAGATADELKAIAKMFPM